MRADLLDAQAAVDWAVAQLPKMQERVINWRRSKPHSFTIDSETEPGKKLYRFRDIRPLDPVVNVEAGIIIHSIRSSLDVLACALAARNGYPGSRSTHFPNAKSAADFSDPKSGPMKHIKRLRQDDQTVIIEDLRPYPGGNDTLCLLHELDLTRKHRRLLKTFVSPRGVFLGGLQDAPYSVHQVDFDEEAVFISTPDSAPDGNPSVSLHVTLDEGYLAQGDDLSAPIREFARTAAAIIKLFD